MIFFQVGHNIWNKIGLRAASIGREGMASGDIDGDGDIDLVLRGSWLENPGQNRERDASKSNAFSDAGEILSWKEHVIGPAPNNFKALVADVNGDGHADVLFSSSENTADVRWWTPASGDPTGTWTPHTIVERLSRAHSLQAADMDDDGDVDVVLGQMHTSAERLIMIYENSDGRATAWQRHIVAHTGIHNGIVADIDADGDQDIYGANWTGNPPIRVWMNQTKERQSALRVPRLSATNWTTLQVTDRHVRTLSLGFGDVDQDGDDDVISGPFIYLNPGGDLTGRWTQRPVPAGKHAFAVLNVDGDGNIDLLAQQSEPRVEPKWLSRFLGKLVTEREQSLGLYWLEADDSSLTSWRERRIGAVPRASHDLGAQGYRLAQIVPGGKSEITISSGNGIYYFEIPDEPSSNPWPRVHINKNPSDEGFAIGDINSDGFDDVIATTGDSKRIEWYVNPGNGKAEWTAYHVGEFPEAVYPDRTEVADLNGDGRLDIVVTEENGAADDATTYWWEQPAGGPSAGPWSRRLLARQATTNSLDTADMDTATVTWMSLQASTVAISES